MKKLPSIVGVALLFAVFMRCGSEVDYNMPQQRQNFRSFFEKLDPLRPDSVLVSGDTKVFKVVATQGEGAVSEVGDTLSIQYAGYLFSASNTTGFGIGNLFTTNVKEDSDELILPPDPLVFTLGTGDVLQGLDYGLRGCQRGEILYVYLTSDLAYGADGLGFVAAGAPVVFSVAVQDVKKKINN